MQVSPINTFHVVTLKVVSLAGKAESLGSNSGRDTFSSFFFSYYYIRYVVH